MSFLTAIVALLIDKVLLVIVALCCQCPSYLLLLFFWANAVPWPATGAAPLMTNSLKLFINVKAE